jgi:protein-S-isoprenylcysteine O-methyltransferase Ste14
MLVSVLIVFLFFVIYAVVHSLLASFPVKQWARRIFGPGVERWYRLAYNLFAVLSLLPLLPLLALLPNDILYVVPSPWRWLMVGGQIVALVCLAMSLLQTGAFHFLGLTQLFAEQPGASGSLAVHGFYRWMRHPVYFFSVLFLWLIPVMTVNLLTVFVLFTIYFYVGSIFEERRLLAEFGEAYRDYQQHVPRLIPIPGRSYTSSPT